MAEHKKKSAAVVNYIIILFLSAFLLLMMTYLMEQREVSENIDGLRTSVSAMKSVDELYNENARLKEELSAKDKEVFAAERRSEDLADDLADVTAELEAMEQSTRALDWFWQINEAFVSGKKTLAISMIESMEEEKLSSYLPLESITDNGRFAPALRYLEIKKELGLMTE